MVRTSPSRPRLTRTTSEKDFDHHEPDRRGRGGSVVEIENMLRNDDLSNGFDAWMPVGPPTPVPVPEGCVGLIIGKGGETIQRLQQGTGAKIQIPNDPQPGSDPPMRVILVAGLPQQRQNAHYEIQLLVEQHNQRNRSTSEVARWSTPTCESQMLAPDAYYQDFWNYAGWYGEEAAAKRAAPTRRPSARSRPRRSPPCPASSRRAGRRRAGAGRGRRRRHGAAPLTYAPDLRRGAARGDRAAARAPRASWRAVAAASWRGARSGPRPRRVSNLPAWMTNAEAPAPAADPRPTRRRGARDAGAPCRRLGTSVKHDIRPIADRRGGVFKRRPRDVPGQPRVLVIQKAPSPPRARRRRTCCLQHDAEVKPPRPRATQVPTAPRRRASCRADPPLKIEAWDCPRDKNGAARPSFAPLFPHRRASRRGRARFRRRDQGHQVSIHETASALPRPTPATYLWLSGDVGNHRRYPESCRSQASAHQLGQGLGRLKPRWSPKAPTKKVVPPLFCGNARVSRAVGVDAERLD